MRVKSELKENSNSLGFTLSHTDLDPTDSMNWYPVIDKSLICGSGSETYFLPATMILERYLRIHQVVDCRQEKQVWSGYNLNLNACNCSFHNYSDWYSVIKV
nr:MAG TPA: hypothetical protein [Caudoviricetes sp.]